MITQEQIPKEVLHIFQEAGVSTTLFLTADLIDSDKSLILDVFDSLNLIADVYSPPEGGWHYCINFTDSEKFDSKEEAMDEMFLELFKKIK